MKNFKKLTVLFLALFVFAGMMSCDMNSGSSDELAVIGEWKAPDYNDATKLVTVLEITSSTCIFHMGAETYKGKIVSYDNTGWNGNESGDGTYGYFVVQYTETASWNTNIKDKFMVVRYQNLKTENGTTTMKYSEGSNYPTSTYYDSADSAIKGAINENGFFDGPYAFSAVTKQN